jgi:hypothetical protein
MNFRPGSNPSQKGLRTQMTQADSVHSTPRETASKINPPVDQARRRFLTVAAAGAASAIAAPALPAARPSDPIFELIEAHRQTHAAHMASLKLQDRFERRYGGGHGGWISEKPCHDEDHAFTEMVAAPATTLPGLIAKLDYFQELSSEFETEWMVNDRAEAADVIQSFAASVKHILVQS